MPQAPLGKEGWRSEKLTRSLFFLSALLFHLVLFLAVASYVIFRSPVAPQETTDFLPTPPAAPIQPPTQVAVSIKAPALPTPPVISTIDSVTPSTPQISVRMPEISNDKGPAVHLPQPSLTTPKGIDIRMPGIRKMNELRGRTPEQIANHDPSCKFPVYVASYADGDWACNTRLDSEGNIVAGSIPDLVAKISEWSNGKVKGEVVPKPLNIASPDLLAKMPPFIFFTGHKDFVLTEQEIENLRQYLNDGGCVWGDNALAGEGSRFDVAFRREMKRVIPDKDKNFVPYSVTDKIFSEGRFPLNQFPTGMNYYAEAPQHLDLDGIVAILYTPNDYSDLMFMRINPGDKDYFMTYRPIPTGTLYTNTSFVEKQAIFYRNFDLQSSLAVHHMGMDIITHLITRFDDRLMLAP